MKKKIGIILTVVVIAAVCVGGFSVYAASRKFKKDTTVNGISVAGMTVSDAARMIDNRVAKYKTTLNLGDQTVILTSRDLGLTSNADKVLRDVLKEQRSNKDKTDFTSNALVTADYNNFIDKVSAVAPMKEKIGDKAIGSDAPKQSESSSSSTSASSDSSEDDTTQGTDPLDPIDATVAYDQGSQQFAVTADQPGQYLVPSKMEKTVTKKLQDLPGSIELNPDDYRLQAKIKTDNKDLKKACEDINSYLDEDITLSFTPSSNGKTYTEQVSRDTLGSLLYLDSDMKVQMDEEGLGTYVSDLASKYKESGKNMPFTTSTGSTITLNVSDGGKQVNTEDLSKELKNDILKKKSGTLEAKYTDSGDGGFSNLWGKNYVEIDLTNQHLWCYKDGNCVVSADVVTGNVSAGHGTPTGVFKIFAKDKDRYLRGTNDNGSKYASYVHFFMPFVGGVGMHDAPWRSAFGGNIYMTNGSHGCINMRYADVQTVFNNVSVGTHVIVYGGASAADVQAAKQAAADAKAKQQAQADTTAAAAARAKIGEISAAGSVDDANGRYNEAMAQVNAIADGTLKQTVTNEANSALATRTQQLNDAAAAAAQQAQAAAEAQAAQDAAAQAQPAQ